MPNVQEGNALNIETTNQNNKHSNFNLSRLVALTPKFGINQPFFSMEVVPDDGPITIEPNCETRSYTLKAPLFGDVKKHVAFYQVPIQAILPNNWEKIVVNSSHGSDVQGSESSNTLVPALDGVNCVVSNFPSRLIELFRSDYDVFRLNLRDSAPPSSDYISNILLFVARWEMFFSRGCLLSSLGVNYGHLLEFHYSPTLVATEYTQTYSFDSFCQQLLSSLSNLEFSIVDNDGTASTGYGSGYKHIRKALDFIRSHSGPFVFNFSKITGSGSYLADTIERYLLSTYDVDESEPLNFGRCVAYQIANAHYYSNDKVDYIYSADLYRQYVGSLVSEIVGATSFIFNGLSVYYDWLSGFYLSEYLDYLANYSYLSGTFWSSYFPYFNAIFGYNYSLRFLDYFVGARPNNLAISGPNTPTNVAVENNSVSVVNTTKSLVAQRFLNSVARAGQSIENYSKKVLGKYIAPDWHNPRYLFSFDSDVFTSEIENTGSDQMQKPNSVTSVLRGSNRNLQFTFDIDRHSFIVGIEYFDVRRFYYTTQDKNTMAVDRFDMFVPGLQYIGDQPLKVSELVAGMPKDNPFGYQLRDLQFKESFDICSGGFVENLPGWLFKFDIDEFNVRNLEEMHIGPEFIRSKPTEIDDMYLSLTGLTLASYFHFIELWNIKVSANRPMVSKPNLL